MLTGEEGALDGICPRRWTARCNSVSKGGCLISRTELYSKHARNVWTAAPPIFRISIVHICASTQLLPLRMTPQGEWYLCKTAIGSMFASNWEGHSRYPSAVAASQSCVPKGLWRRGSPRRRGNGCSCWLKLEPSASVEISGKARRARDSESGGRRSHTAI